MAMTGIITVGIAGHVDHGKTSLVRVITGVDTDRMQDEKRRGMSIEFGVAPLMLGSGRVLSIVDVPGHTDYLKNTIRGLSAVDGAVLVVAADDGVMPQTKEHLEVLRFFEVRRGIVVLTKADLVDEETLELAGIEVRDAVQGTFLSSAPVIPFSAHTLQGAGEVLSALENLSEAHVVPSRGGRTQFRMFVDQVRSIRGHGTVVSGTVVSGEVHPGDRVEIVPGGKVVRVRSIQTHHRFVDAALPGMRAGINLQGADVHEIPRGHVLAEPGSLVSSRFLDCAMSVSGLAREPVENMDRLRVFVGPCVTTARVVLMEGQRLEPGSSGLVQLRLDDEVGACAFDRFVAVGLGEPRVVAGGRVLQTTCEKYRKARFGRIVPFLKAVMGGDEGVIVDAWVSTRPDRPVSARMLGERTGIDPAGFAEAIRRMFSRDELVAVDRDEYVSRAYLEGLQDDVLRIVEKDLEAEKNKASVSASALVKSLPAGIDRRVVSLVLDGLVRMGRLVEVGGGYATEDAARCRKSGGDALVGAVLAVIASSGLAAVSAGQILEALGQERMTRPLKSALDFLVSQGEIARLPNDRYMSKSGVEEAKARAEKAIREKGFITPADCREIFGFGRTAGIPLLEYLDSLGFTERRENVRVLKEIRSGA